MKKVYIFDFDGTIVDTSIIKPLRDKHLWSACFTKIPETAIYDGMIQLLNSIKKNLSLIVIVSHSPKNLIEGIARHHSVVYDYLYGYHDFENHLKPNPFLLKKIIKDLGDCDYYGIGDEERDLLFYHAVGIKAICAGWNKESNKSFDWDFTVDHPLGLLGLK